MLQPLASAGEHVFIQFISLPSWLQLLIWALGGIALGGAVTLAVRRITSPNLRAEHNDETGVVVAIVGVFYALIVTALLVKAVAHFDAANVIVEREANLASSVVHLARATSSDLGEAATRDVARYLRETVELEWPIQQEGRAADLTFKALDALADRILRFEPADDNQRAVYSSLVAELARLHDARLERSFRVHTEIPIELWSVSIAGEIGLVLFAMLMQMRSVWMHFLMASALSVSISVVFALILIFDTPFSGDICVSPAPYSTVLTRVLGPHR
jgi:hypothetical protein